MPFASVSLGPGPLQSWGLLMVAFQAFRCCLESRDSGKSWLSCSRHSLCLVMLEAQTGASCFPLRGRGGVGGGSYRPHQIGATCLLPQIRNSSSHTSEWALLTFPQQTGKPD